jgi:hypothetical protein
VRVRSAKDVRKGKKNAVEKCKRNSERKVSKSFDVEIFNVKTIQDLEVREQCKVKVSDRFCRCGENSILIYIYRLKKCCTAYQSISPEDY